MANYLLPHFGELDLDNLEPYTTQTIDLKNHSVVLDLNLLHGHSVSESEMKLIQNFLENLEAYTDKVKTILPTDYAAEGATYDYLNEFLMEMEDDDLLSVLHDTDEELPTEFRLLEKLYIKRISFYPEKEDDLLAVIDYALSGVITEDVLVVLLNKQLRLKDIVVERA
jgi:hypothetical protein